MGTVVMTCGEMRDGRRVGTLAKCGRQMLPESWIIAGGPQWIARLADVCCKA